jgi:hypothetical protein
MLFSAASQRREKYIHATEHTLVCLTLMEITFPLARLVNEKKAAFLRIQIFATIVTPSFREYQQPCSVV